MTDDFIGTLQGDRELTMTRTVDAPLDLVWAAHTEAEHLKHWWARGHKMDVDLLDFRPGGSWRFVEHGDNGERWAFRGEFREIAEHELIVMTFEYEGAPGHVSIQQLRFQAEGARTTITGTLTFENQADRDAMVGSGMEEGARQSYRALDAYLAELAA